MLVFLKRATFFAQCITLAALSSTYGHAQPLLVGYFPQWGLYQNPQYTVKDLASHANMLDQVNYAQGFVKNGRCTIADPNADTNFTFSAAQSVDGVSDDPAQPLRGNLNQLIKLKKHNPQIKMVISLEGGARDFAADAQPEARVAFVQSCVDLWIKGNAAPGIALGNLFDGIDIDWESPHTEDAINYVELLKEFRRQMNAVRPHTLLTAAVGPSTDRMGGANIATVASLVDEVGLMTYDFSGPWAAHTGFASALSGGPGTVNDSVQQYLAAGVPAAKLLAGVPFYGYGWRLVPTDHDGLNQEGDAIHGEHPYREIEPKIATSTIHRDQRSQSPWLFNGDEFWTYEDAVSVAAKADYVVNHGLGGIMIWELGEDTDDATLLNAAYEGMRTHEAQHGSEGAQ
jgi:chitinase